MSDASNIEWTDATWNPVRGCDPVSPGCANCYAATVAARFSGPGLPYEGLAVREKGQPAKWTGVIALVDDKLREPLSWKEPRKVFVNSMSDLFHKDVPDSFIDKVFAVMALAPRHTFQVLTKRADRMAAYLDKNWMSNGGWSRCMVVAARCCEMSGESASEWPKYAHVHNRTWPLPNVWLGTSVENQAAADERIPHLLRTPAAVRFLSCEPLISPVDLSAYMGGSQDGNRRFGRAGDGRGGDVLGGPAGASLASPGDHAGECGGRAGSRDRTAPSGHRAVEGGRLSSGPVHGRQDPLSHGRSPSGVDGREPAAHTDRDGGEPQGRQQGQQPPGQPGDHDARGERTARTAHAGAHEGAGHSRGETYPVAGGGDTPPVRRKGHVEGGHRATLRCDREDGAEHRQADQVGEHPGIHWVICGGESGPGARPMHPAWARSLRDQCAAAGVAFFFKQWGAWMPWPMDDWNEKDRTTLDGDTAMFRHGHLAKQYDPRRYRTLDGREWNEFPTPTGAPA